MTARAKLNEQQRIAGALAIIEALRKIEREIEEEPEEAPDISARDSLASFHNLQITAANRLADAVGEMTAFQRGAFLALAEHIHFNLTTGTPDLTNWLPIAAQTAEHYAADFEEMVSQMERDERKFKAGGSESCPA